MCWYMYSNIFWSLVGKNGGVGSTQLFFCEEVEISGVAKDDSIPSVFSGGEITGVGDKFLNHFDLQNLDVTGLWLGVYGNIFLFRFGKPLIMSSGLTQAVLYLEILVGGLVQSPMKY